MKLVIRIFVLALAAGIGIYMGMPVVAYGFLGLPALLLAMVALFSFTDVRLAQHPTIPGQVIIKSPQKMVIPGIIVLVLLFYMIVLPWASSTALFRWDDYRKLIGQVEEGKNLSSHMAPISIEKIRVVDQALANLLGDKVLGAQPALGSQVKLGEFNIQKVRDQLYWVAPLLHSGFFKWNKNREGSAGYVMVNATNERDVKLVQQVGGKPVRIKYQPEGYFDDFLERHLYFNGFYNIGLTDYSFEIDDDGVPYWVVTKYTKKVGFQGDDAVGIVVVNASTGECKEYSIDNAPLWVDRIQPGSFIEKQLSDWGEYVKGFWNFSNENKLQITEGVTLVYGEDNRSYWYTGLTSVGADEATVGFVLVDTRTKKATWYKQGGATEFAAQKSASGKVQEKRFSASQPIPYNINNIPTYVLTLKDNGGLVKMYAMVAIEDYTIVGVGNTMEETLMAYKNAYNMTGNKVNVKSATNKMILDAIIERIHSDIKNGNSFYYFTVKGQNRTFIGSSQISNELPITEKGDSVRISFDDDTRGLIDISSFSNKSLGLSK